MIQRWKDELSNRRQYLSYLQSLFEDVSKCGGKVSSLRDMYLSELDDLASVVGGRNSVPKEHVYPKFDKIAKVRSMYTLYKYDAPSYISLRPPPRSPLVAALDLNFRRA